MTENPISVGIIGVHPYKGWATITHVPALQRLLEHPVTTICNKRVKSMAPSCPRSPADLRNSALAPAFDDAAEVRSLIDAMGGAADV
ncbi:MULTISPECIES: hypothetical protein [unclassified Mesorhizobium]|uniref:hypothetical protein n=1 Tax=unclassified Mesorhizobium TaxID=325217 RepID=UPI001CCECD99|nr:MULTISPECIES: hypothetical protein [unclassified Mesorhizobium]MBZ9742208.1 hypothetical protein [Mesorhizobium sp. CO1-1-4]MBZ9774047.1 hypothetical protein [Mesorhizobium sp. CO1-1-8]MBZ9805813.1 hypothetical protein [Mesorhizobium sp. ES1-6]MBZ9996218.1 hypothetical protein [Mesorhizobium sp. BH1-1-4]